MRLQQPGLDAEKGYVERQSLSGRRENRSGFEERYTRPAI